MTFDYSQEIFKEWTIVKGIKFLRKLENETAFDGVIKIYSIQTDNDKLNEILKGLYFGTIGHKTTNGILLRQFLNKNSWPKTMLVFLDISNFNLTVVNKTNSSYQNWEIKELTRGKYKINLTPTESVDFIDI
ncbi:MAG: hypothetical protein C0459_06450 [Chitinophaga sp.]|jgi:hypothetical protein|nr:hypothetical protein [Chitinophaga sp.]